MSQTPIISEAEETRRGELLVKLLNLRPAFVRPKPAVTMYHTQWGTKTALGLFRMVERLVKDGE